MELRNMLRYKMGWADPSGPKNEVVLSSRIRLARNLREFPFPSRGNAKAHAAVLSAALEAAGKTKALGKAARIRLDAIEPLDRALLVERHLASRNLVDEPKNRAVLVGDREVASLMVNEEDHLRLQVIDSGLCLEELFKTADALDDELSASLDFAFRPDWGYLAACPTNTGTGLRASCLVHLPGLGMLRQMDRVLDGLSRLGVVARGLYGEGTQVMGDFYQISNGTALGAKEKDILATISKVVSSLVQKELDARQAMAQGQGKRRLEDLVWRALGALMNARVMTFQEAMGHLSAARMALSLGWDIPADMNAVNELIVQAQPAHVQMLAGKELAPEDRDYLRAALLRRKFK